jgi:hypothetical protein
MKLDLYRIAFILIFIILAFFVVQMSLHAFASQQEKVDLCHQTQSDTNPWVEQSVNANEVQSHLDNGDFLIDEEHPCPPVEVVEPTVTPTPTSYEECDGQWCEEVTPTPTVELTPTPTDEATPSATPTETERQTPPSDHGDGLGDGHNDGRGCASNDCNTQRYVNESGVPLYPPSQAPK